MVCKYCGAEIFSNGKFCQKCGRGIGGEINPSKKEKMKKQLEKELLPICKRFSNSLDNSKAVDNTYKEYIKASEELERIDKRTVPLITLPLIVTAILAAVFAVLIPGLNINNEDFQWILKGRAIALALCCSTAFIPYYALSKFLASAYDTEIEFTLGDLGKSLIIGLVCGWVISLILAFLNGLFGKAFVPTCIVLAALLVIFAIVLIVRWVTDSDTRTMLSDKKAEVERLRQAYEKKFEQEVTPICEKYKGIFSDDELDNCVINARSAQARANLKEASETLDKMRGE